jgi:hypothetical protein
MPRKRSRSRSKSRSKSRSRNLIPKLKKGLLAKYGYHDVMHMTQKARRAALRKALKAYGRDNLIDKLNAVVVLNKNTNPTLSRRFAMDRNWVEKQKGGRSKSRSRSRKRRSKSRIRSRKRRSKSRSRSRKRKRKSKSRSRSRKRKSKKRSRSRSKKRRR